LTQPLDDKKDETMTSGEATNEDLIPDPLSKAPKPDPKANKTP